MRRLFLTAWAALTVGCAPATNPGVREDEVVLGMTAPLTGPAAAWGSVALGARAWAGGGNALGGVHPQRHPLPPPPPPRRRGGPRPPPPPPPRGCGGGGPPGRGFFPPPPTTAASASCSAPI